MKFESLQVGKAMVDLLEKHGITIPTPIQREIIPAIKEGRDVLAQSETGSGKTVSFAIPIIEQTKRNEGLTTLVLVPTRELCIQVSGEFMKFSQGNHLGITSVYGGVSINMQAKKMKTTNVIVATPGRLIDLMNRNVVKLDAIQYLVLDEADRMLDMGFIPDIEKILKRMPQKKQTMLFSATVSKEIEHLSMKYLNDPKLVSFESKVKPEFLQQTYYYVKPDQRIPLLIHLLKNERDLALVFCNKKHVTAKLAKKLSTQGIHARCLHGDMSQPQRERATAEFRNKKVNVLIATDVAARGLHIEDITHVYNFEIPRDVESYTHRVGRTARAGKKGEAISMVATEEDKKFFKQILFTYRGNIALKTISDIDLPIVDEAPKEVRKPRRTAEHAEAGEQEGERRERPPQRERTKKREDHGRPQRKDRKREGDARPQRTARLAPSVGEKEGLPPKSESYSTHSGRHQQRNLNDRKRTGGDAPTREGRYSRTDRKPKSTGREGLPKDRPRRRKPFETDTREKSYRQNDLSTVMAKKARTEPPEPDEKKSKKNWKEMWQRLING